MLSNQAYRRHYSGLGKQLVCSTGANVSAMFTELAIQIDHDQLKTEEGGSYISDAKNIFTTVYL